MAAIDTLTENNLQGNGTFDRIMSSIELHIHDEHAKQRITGANYAQAYIAAIQYGIQAAVQMAIQGDVLDLQKQLLEAQIKETEAKVKLTEKQIELVDEQIKQASYDKELKKWQAVTEQTHTQKIIAINKDTVDKELVDGSNIHGIAGNAIRLSAAQAWAVKRSAELNVAKVLVTDVFNTIESAEGVAANKFGLNGSNAVSILSDVRKNVGFQPIDTTETEYNTDSQKFKDKWAPEATDETEDN